MPCLYFTHRGHGCWAPCFAWLKFCRYFHEKMEKTFAASSGVIVTYPRATVLIGLMLVGFLSIGFIFLRFENRTVKIFVPQGSQGMEDLDKASKYFPLKIREEIVILVPKPGEELLSARCFEDALRVHKEVMKLPSYTSLCLASEPTTQRHQSSGSCVFVNPLELFNFDTNDIVNVSSRLIDATDCSPPIIMRNGHPSCQNMNRMFGNTMKNITSASILEAEAMRMVYYLRDADSDSEYSNVLAWEKTFIDLLDSLRTNMSCAKVLYSAERSLDDAIEDSSTSDIRYFSLTFTLMINFANIMLGKMFRNPLTGHSLLGMGGVVCVALGVAAGFGLSMFAQTPFVKIVGILPFLVVGVAIDDMFIMIDELDMQPRDLSVRETVTRVMSRTGSTITMTTVTDLVAFAVSTMSQFPSVKYFCIYAALTITFAYLLMVTVFVALMSFDVKRIKANRRNCLPLCIAPPPKDGQPPWDEPRQSIASKLMEKWGKFLMDSRTKPVIVLLSIGLLGAGIYGTMNVSESFSRSLLVRDNSQYKEFLETQKEFFDRPNEVSIVVDQRLDYDAKKTQEALQDLGTIVTQNTHYKDTVSSWIDQFVSYCNYGNLTSEGQDFLPNLKAFLKIPMYSHFAQDVKFSTDEQHIVASRVIGYMEGSESSVYLRDAMLTLRKDVSTMTSLPAYPIARSFIFLEQYAVIVTETIKNLAVASLAIMVITSPFLVDFIAILLVSLGFISLIFELFGLMAIWGVSLNAISMINLVMAIGFSVDYSAHIALAFLKSKETTPEKQVVYALKNVGASVLLGGTSTLLGILLTSLSDSEIFRTFFKMFFGMVLLGLLHGLCFLPVYLSIFGRFCQRVSVAPSVSIPMEAEICEKECHPASLGNGDVPESMVNGDAPESMVNKGQIIEHCIVENKTLKSQPEATTKF